jgi:Flp pilus assembly pilin Flp
MMRRLLVRDDRGAAAIEMAFALPALVMLIWGIVQLGMAFRAVAGIQHSLGEGARLATIWPQPAYDAIEAKMEEVVYGIEPGTFTIHPPEPGLSDAGEAYLDLKVSYTQPTNLLLLPGPTITVEREKRVWVAE